MSCNKKGAYFEPLLYYINLLYVKYLKKHILSNKYDIILMISIKHWGM